MSLEYRESEERAPESLSTPLKASENLPKLGTTREATKTMVRKISGIFSAVSEFNKGSQKSG